MQDKIVNLLVQLSGENNFRVIEESTGILVYSSYEEENIRTIINIAGIPLAKAIKGETIMGYHWNDHVHIAFLAWHNEFINNLEVWRNAHR